MNKEGSENKMLMFVRANKLSHSAKGSEWEKHKYIKKLNGDYYYPDDYKNGRHLTDDEKKIPVDEELDQDMIEDLARSVISGIFGNGQIRKDLLGESYQKVQDRVNEILLSNISEVPKERKDAAKEILKEVADNTKTKISSNNKYSEKLTKTPGQMIFEKASKKLSTVKRSK